MSLTYRGPQWKRASIDERLLLLAGIPSQYWKPLVKLPPFLGITIPAGDHKIRITPERQLDVYTRLLERADTLLSSGVVAIGSSETDDVALHLGVNLIRHYLTLPAKPAKVIDLGRVPSLDETDHSGNNIGRDWWRIADAAPIVLLYNIIPLCACDSRVVLLRDLLSRFSEATRIVIIAGTDPFDFMVDRVHYRPDVILHTRGGFSAKRESR